jgi:hypothetical protein
MQEVSLERLLFWMTGTVWWPRHASDGLRFDCPWLTLCQAGLDSDSRPVSVTMTRGVTEGWKGGKMWASWSIIWCGSIISSLCSSNSALSCLFLFRCVVSLLQSTVNVFNDWHSHRQDTNQKQPKCLLAKFTRQQWDEAKRKLCSVWFLVQSTFYLT